LSTVKVREKWQITIPQAVRERIEALRMGGEVKVWAEGNRIVVQPIVENWVERLGGLGKEIWRKVDAVDYVRNLRKESEKSLKRKHIEGNN